MMHKSGSRIPNVRASAAGISHHHRQCRNRVRSQYVISPAVVDGTLLTGMVTSF